MTCQEVFGVESLELDGTAVDAVDCLVKEVITESRGTAGGDILAHAHELAAKLPATLRRALTHLRDAEGESGLLITGLPVDSDAIGPTPRHWRETPASVPASRTRREEIILALIAEFIGFVFGYATLQDGRLFHHLLPIPGEEAEQSGHSSSVELDWHSEDAFTHARCDFLGLLALRNPDRVETLVAPGAALNALSDADREVLSQPRFVVRADDEHVKNLTVHPSTATASIHHAPSRRPLIPVLYGGSDRPYLVLDKAFMRPQPGDAEASAAFRHAVQCLDESLRPVALRPGDVLLVDNHRAVHGRAPFRARYDGSDRWLLKVSITRDLMKSRPFRASAASRVVR
jgi:Fe(II)/alpha-ketoglutarate-dependent arginine beta-hydroxylase